MVLERQTIALPFAQGIDTKTADIHVQPGRLLDLQNGEFDRGGSVSKRKGFAQLGNATLDGASLAAESLHVFDTEMYMYGTDGTNSGYFAYDDTGDKWVAPYSDTADNALHAKISTSIVPSGFAISAPTSPRRWQDVAINAGYALHCFSALIGGADATVVSIVDLSTGSAVHLGTALTAATKCRAIAFGNYLGVVIGVSNTLSFRYVDVTSDPSTLSSVNLKTDLNTNANSGVWDVYPGTDQGVASYMDTSDDMYTFTFTQAGTTATSAAVAVNASTSYCSVTTNSGVAKTAIYNSAAVQGFGFAVAGLASSYALTGILTAASVTKVVCEDDGTKVFWEIPDVTDFYKSDIQTGTIDNSGTVSGVASLTKGSFLVGRPKTVDGRALVPVQRLGDLQRPFFLLENGTGSEVVVAHFEAGLGVPNAIYSSNGEELHSNMVTYDSDEYMAISTQIGFLSGIDEGIFTTKLVKIDVTTEPGRFGQEFILGGTKGFTGSRLMLINGGAHTEAGFHQSPEGISAVAANSANSVPTGTFNVKALYSWYDKEGNRYTSAPSEAVSITLTGGEDTITVTLPAYWNTLREGVKIEIYRTKNAGTIYYLDGVGTSSLTTVNPSVSCTLSDADVGANRTLYTTGGVLENRPIGACSSPVVRRDRLFLLMANGDIAYSKKFIRGEGLAFADEFRTVPDTKHGPVHGLASQDGRVIVLARDGIFYFDGDGPNNLGQGAFTSLRDVVSPVGMLENSPLLTTSKGTFFVSRRGPELLSRDLQVVYVGAPAENAYTGTITGADNFPAKNEVRFITSTGDSLSYNYLYDQWSTWPGVNGLTSKVWKNDHVIMQTGGRVWRQGTDFFDNAVAYPILLDTAWVKAGGEQGWQKIFEVALLGDYKSEHVFQVKAYYDYSETASQTVSLTMGSDLDPLQLSFIPETQKCQAVRFRVEDVSPAGTAESFSLSHLQLTVADAGGIARLAVAQTG